MAVQSISGYRWATANDVTARDPVAWAIDVSSDCSAYTNSYELVTRQVGRQ